MWRPGGSLLLSLGMVTLQALALALALALPFKASKWQGQGLKCQGQDCQGQGRYFQSLRPGQGQGLTSLVNTTPSDFLHFNTESRYVDWHASRRQPVIKCHTQITHMWRLKLLPVKYHSELLAKQYWLSCYQPHHPCHHLTTLPAPARNMTGTLMKYNSEVVPLSDEAITDVDTYRDCLVVEAKTNFVPNKDATFEFFP